MNLEMTALADLAPALQILVGGVIALQLALIVVSLVVLARLGAGAVAGAPRWLWLIVILLGQLPGSLVFLVVARVEHTARRRRREFEAHAKRPDPASSSDVIAGLYRSRSR